MKILLWGTGKTTEKFIEKADFTEDIEIIGIIDGNDSCIQKNWKGYSVIKMQDVDNYNYDLVIICSIYVDEIYNTISKFKFKKSKIIFLRENTNRNIWMKTLEYIKLKKIVNNASELYKGEIITQVIKNFIYVILGKIYLYLLSLNKKKYYICCPYGIGDTIFVAGLCYEYQKQIGDSRKIVLIVKKGHILIPSYYSSIDDKIVSNNLVNILRICCEQCSIKRKENFLYGHFLPNYKLSENVHVIEEFLKEVFCISEEGIELTIPNLPCINKKINNENVIVLLPYAYSIENYSITLWNEIAHIFLINGYDVYTNTKDETEKEINGTKRLELNFQELIKFCQGVDYVISIRSGICDLLCYVDINMIVLYGNSMLHTLYTLKRLGGKAYLNEIITDEVSEREIVNMIENIILKKNGCEV